MTSSKGADRVRILSKDYLLLMVMEVLIGTCSVMSMTTLVLYGNFIGLTATAAGFLSAVFAVFSLIGRPFSGVLCDRLRRKNLLYVSLLLFSVTPLTFVFTDNVVVSIISRAICGFAMSIATTVYSTIVTDIIPKERFAEGLGYFGIGASISSAASAAIGLWLIGSFGYDGMFIATSLMGFSALVCSVFLSKKHNEKRPGPVMDEPGAPKKKRALSDVFEKKALFPTGMNMLMIFIQTCMMQILPAFALYKGQMDIGSFYIISAVGILLPKLLSSVIERTMKTKGFLVLGGPMVVLALLGIQLLPMNAVTLALCAFLYGFGYSSVGIAFKASALYRVPEERRGIANATFLLAGDIGFSIAPILWGGYVDTMGVSGVFFVASSISMLCLILSFVANVAATKKGEPLFDAR